MEYNSSMEESDKVAEFGYSKDSNFGFKGYCGKGSTGIENDITSVTKTDLQKIIAIKDEIVGKVWSTLENCAVI